MKKNEDTYVLPEESDALLSEILPTTNPLRITWEVLTPDEKAGYLQAAARRLEGLNFIGRKVSYFQPLKFPRIANGIPPEFEDAPREVKRAQTVWACEIVREELYVNKRNAEACVALGLIGGESVEQPCAVPSLVKELLQRWLTQWRRI